MAAPVVQNLNDIVAQIKAAYAPQQAQLDTEIGSNDQSGAAQVSGLDAAKTGAFGQITTNANTKGMTFSGFSPDAEAKYTGSTYLPALAKLQATIAGTRGTLLGKKADIDTQANTQGLTVQQSQQKELNDYNTMMEQQAQAERQRLADQAFQASENAKNRSASAANAAASRSAAAPAQPTVQQAILQAFAGAGYSKGAKGGFTENTLVPTLMADYGLSKADATKQAYTIRKSVYGD